MYRPGVKRIRGSQWQIRRLRWRGNTPFRVWILFVMMLLAVIVALVLVATLS